MFRSFFLRTVVLYLVAQRRDVLLCVPTHQPANARFHQVQLVQEQLEVTALLEGEDGAGDSKPKTSSASGVQEMDCA